MPSNKILDQSLRLQVCSWLLDFSPEGDTSLPVCVSHRTPRIQQKILFSIHISNLLNCHLSVLNSPQRRKVRQVQEGRGSEKRVRFNPVLALALRALRLCGEFGVFKALVSHPKNVKVRLVPLHQTVVLVRSPTSLCVFFTPTRFAHVPLAGSVERYELVQIRPLDGRKHKFDPTAAVSSGLETHGP